MSKQTEQDSLRLAVLQQIQSLVTAGLGLVAALAWNTAIQDLFKLVFPNQGSLTAKFLYAIFITLLIVILTRRLGKAISLLQS